MEKDGTQVRQRSRRACLPCHQRKRKCDGDDPCGTCKGYGYNCCYTTPQEANIIAWPKTQNSTVSNKRQKLTPPVITDEHVEPNTASAKVVSEGVLEPTKSRYVGASSAIVFPMTLAKELGSQDTLKLHSYGWNTGTRPEQPDGMLPSVTSLLTWHELKTLSTIFFEAYHPVFGFIDRDSYERRCLFHWNGDTQPSGFDAIVSGVCALGSLCAGAKSSVIESALVQHAKSTLDNVSVIHAASCDHVSAWILRSLYLRMTTRPHASWVSSCTTIHIAEAVGLHRELDTLIIASRSSTIPPLSATEREFRRRTFWVAWSLNQLFSCEYGRTPVHVNDINCSEPTGFEFDHTCSLLSLAQIASRTTSQSKEVLHTLPSILRTDKPPLLNLIEANVVFCVFRKLRLLDSGPTRGQVENCLSIGKNALKAVRALMAQNNVFWDVLGVPFHFVCIILAINTSESLASLSDSMQTLRDVVGYLQTHMAKEALRTAQLLVDAAHEKKKRELDLLGAQIRQTPDTPPVQDTQATINGMQLDRPFTNWLYSDNADMDLFLGSFAGNF